MMLIEYLYCKSIGGGGGGEIFTRTLVTPV